MANALDDLCHEQILAPQSITIILVFKLYLRDHFISSHFYLTSLSEALHQIPATLIKYHFDLRPPLLVEQRRATERFALLFRRYIGPEIGAVVQFFKASYLMLSKRVLSKARLSFFNYI